MAYYEGIINKAKTSSFRQNKPKWMRSKWRRERDSNPNLLVKAGYQHYFSNSKLGGF